MTQTRPTKTSPAKKIMNSKIAALLVALTAFGSIAPIGTALAQTATPSTAPAAAPAAAAPAATAPAAPVAEAAKAAETAVAPATAAGAAAVKPPSGGDTGENPYGLKALISHGDPVDWIVLGLLLIMSMGTWYIIFTKFVEQSKMNGFAAAAKKTFWSAGSVRQGADTLSKESPYRFVTEQALEATKKHDGLLAHVDYNTWVTQGIERSVSNVQGRTQDGLAFLATVGATAPFVGLFGTVWGIYNALVKIGLSGQASIDKVAGPVGSALIMTAIGLAVAVPAVLGYNWLVRRNKAAMDNVREFGSDLHSALLASQKR